AEMGQFCYEIFPKIARLNSDGSLDESFGTAGFIDLSNLGKLENFSNQILVYPDGDFVFTGTTQNYDGSPCSVLLAKFKEDGSPDPAFGQAGVLSIQTNFSAIGQVTATFHLFGRMLIGISGYKLALYRVNEFGTMDGTFGSGGKVEVPFPTEDVEVGGIATLADGTILIGASSGYSSTDFAFAAKRLATGEPDASFGINGLAKIPFNENCHATGLALQPDGKILVGGMAGSGDGEDYFLTRFLANGSIDNTFGTGGVAKHLDPAADHCATTLQIQPDGKLLLAGFTVQGKASMARFQLESALATNPTPAPVSCYRLSPNPSSDLAELRFSLLESGLTRLSLSNLAGDVIWQTEKLLPGGEHQEMLDFPNLPAGVYFVKISNANGSAVEKMVRN
ncbi:MAG: T9SS type A sorting domain-containing protein, partial [Bacteroidota bacterium]